MKFYLLMFILCCLPVMAEEKSGPIILVGGGKVPDKAVKWMKEKSRNDKFIIVTCYPERDKRWKEFFGQPKFFLPEDLKIEEIKDIGGLVIEGGDQWEYVKRLDGKIIDEAHRKGIAILGTSAGSMILAEKYFSAEEGSITSEEAEAGEHVCIAEKFVLISHLKQTFVETHYTQRNRQKRLKVFMEKSGATRGIGIDESTALCIDENGEHTTFGEGNVDFVTLDIK